MTKEIKARLRLVNLYLETNNASLVCRRCGISKPTLRLWVRRFQKDGFEGLQSKSKQPTKTPEKKVISQIEQWVLALHKRRFGSRRIQSDLIRLYDCSLSRRTVQKILAQHQQSPLKVSRRTRKTVKRCAREVAGDRVQMDIGEITKHLYQYTAIDDCTRLKVIKLYPEKSAASSLDFLEYVIEELPFPMALIYLTHSLQ